MDEHTDDFLDYEYPEDAVDDPNDPLNFDDDLYFDGDICPNCGRDTTIRIDIIADEPTIWIATCATCGEDFEVTVG